MKTKEKLAGKRANVELAFQYVNKSIGRKADDPGGGTPRYRGRIFGADAWGDYYFLWSVERVGVIYKKNKFDDKGLDWYEWGRPDCPQSSANGSQLERQARPGGRYLFRSAVPHSCQYRPGT